MKNKKISTNIVIVVIVIAITIGMFVWQWEKGDKIANKDNPVIQKNKVQIDNQKNQTQQQTSENNQGGCLSENNSNNVKWDVFKNDQFKFEIQYPNSFIYKEQMTDTSAHPPGDGVKYVITIGNPTKITQGNSFTCVAGSNFLMYISDIGSGLNNYIKNAKQTAGDVENSFEPIGTERVASFIAQIIKTCDQGGNCNKDVYFTDKKYIYSIRLSNYFNPKEASDKNTVDRMMGSLRFE